MRKNAINAAGNRERWSSLMKQHLLAYATLIYFPLSYLSFSLFIPSPCTLLSSLLLREDGWPRSSESPPPNFSSHFCSSQYSPHSQGNNIIFFSHAWTVDGLLYVYGVLFLGIKKIIEFNIRVIIHEQSFEIHNDMLVIVTLL